MASQVVSIEQWGTFDVANYGDLLFPVVLEHELSKRLNEFQLGLASPKGGAFLPDPTRSVRRIGRFEDPDFYAQAIDTEVFVVGGGDIIRFDDHSMARIYHMSHQQAQLERCYSLFLEDTAKLARVRPVFWNAVGVPSDFAPEQHKRVCDALQHVRFLSVRDHRSKRRLQDAGLDREIHVVPDTAFVIPDVFPKEGLTTTINRLRQLGYFPLGGKVLTFQVSAAFGLVEDDIVAILIDLLNEFPDLALVLLPIGICHDDLSSLRRISERMGTRAFLIDIETDLVQVAAVLAHSDYFAGFSFHGNVTAWAYGVDHLILHILPKSPTKLKELSALLGREACLVRSMEEMLPRLRDLIRGKYPVDPHVHHGITQQVHTHFDRLASLIASCHTGATDEDLIRRLDREHRQFARAAEVDRQARSKAEDEVWKQRLDVAKEEIEALVPAGGTFILVDDGQWGSSVVPGRWGIPLLEREGHYWGPPADDDVALREFERVRFSGARLMVFGWPAFWWLDHYAGLHEYLRSRFHCVLQNERLVVFDLRP